MMKHLTSILLLLIVGCSTRFNDADIQGHSTNSISYHIEGVANPGDYESTNGITISEAIDKAGGLRNCEYCYKNHGEKYLRKTLAGAKVIPLNSDGFYRVKKDKIETWEIKSGDHIEMLHYGF